MRVGILTGGGDCPGLNPAIKAIVEKAALLNHETVGLREGWLSVVDKNHQKPENILNLTPNSVRHIDRHGGTILGTSRTNPFNKEFEKNHKSLIKSWWKNLELDALVAIGGEDTLGVANRLYSEFNLPVVGIPKTIDGDLNGTEYCLGFETAVQVITESVDALRSTAESHSRIFVVEAMGRHAGHLALKGGISSGASVILIPEYDFQLEKVIEILKDRKDKGCRYSIILISEGAKPKISENNNEKKLKTKSESLDAFGHVELGGIGNWLALELKKEKFDARCVVLSHLQRAGAPLAYDRRMGLYFGTAAVEAIEQKKFGQMTARKEGKIILLPLSEAVRKLRTVNIEKSYNTEKYWGKREVLVK